MKYYLTPERMIHTQNCKQLERFVVKIPKASVNIIWRNFYESTYVEFSVKVIVALHIIQQFFLFISNTKAHKIHSIESGHIITCCSTENSSYIIKLIQLSYNRGVNNEVVVYTQNGYFAVTVNNEIIFIATWMETGGLHSKLEERQISNLCTYLWCI